jgi:citrate synthase
MSKKTNPPYVKNKVSDYIQKNKGKNALINDRLSCWRIIVKIARYAKYLHYEVGQYMKMKNQDRDSITEEFLYILNGINIFF